MNQPSQLKIPTDSPPSFTSGRHSPSSNDRNQNQLTNNNPFLNNERPLSSNSSIYSHYQTNQSVESLDSSDQPTLTNSSTFIPLNILSNKPPYQPVNHSDQPDFLKQSKTNLNSDLNHHLDHPNPVHGDLGGDLGSSGTDTNSNQSDQRNNQPRFMSTYSPVKNSFHQTNPKYPPSTPSITNTANALIQHPNQLNPIKRPPVWKRIIWDTTPIDQKILNHQNGIGIQDRAYVSWVLSFGMLIALIMELITNARYQGTPISTKPTFNFLIGPSTEILINVGARFTPCIKYVPNVSNISFPCLNTTTNDDSCTQPLEQICGFGGFRQPGQPDQTFRFILPLFLHAGLIHYILNIAVQLTSSALIERQMGSLRFLLLYIPSGVFGFVLGGNFSLIGQPSVGASGAIFSTYAAILVDLVAHWSIEYRPARKLGFLLFEVIGGLALGLIPGIDNFSHIGGFSMGLLLAILLFPVLHQTMAHRWTFYTVRTICLVGAILMFILLYKNFFLEDPAASCNWCRYLSCWPTASNNRCKGTGLRITETTTPTPNNTNRPLNNSTSSSTLMSIPLIFRLLMGRIKIRGFKT
ncbi:hypothetical protein O181_056707 [Austropuccinia psidii MF-1]|uniref:Rhomboid-type serine protease n=1 Tax=Austropuccinia psidii MF-1 TaxID=1389203 RepID=A0A9Q3EG97_9BASI|nr:hypothetical protein [Austropuccinia psidii MF-1]